MKNIEQETLSSIVLAHHQVIPVLEKYDLDFCCRGNKTLSEACVDKNINLATVAGEMRDTTTSAKMVMPFTEMTADQLISHILVHHHFYVKQTILVIMNMLEKITSKHGPRYPHMYEVYQRFTAVKQDLEPHMQKEEQILFPRIKEIATIPIWKERPDLISSHIVGSIAVMQTEHDIAGQLMYEIRRLTSNYTAPDDACTTHMVCLETLKAFEADLHQHVHLENNILFPMAMNMINSQLAKQQLQVA